MVQSSSIFQHHTPNTVHNSDGIQETCYSVWVLVRRQFPRLYGQDFPFLSKLLFFQQQIQSVRKAFPAVADISATFGVFPTSLQTSFNNS